MKHLASPRNKVAYCAPVDLAAEDLMLAPEKKPCPDVTSLSEVVL
jgi:hypothetical protein